MLSKMKNYWMMTIVIWKSNSNDAEEIFITAINNNVKVRFKSNANNVENKLWKNIINNNNQVDRQKKILTLHYDHAEHRRKLMTIESETTVGTCAQNSVNFYCNVLIDDI